MNLRIWLLIAFVAVAAGCGMTEMFNTDPGYDYKKLPDGTAVLLDTPRMWNDWVAQANSVIRAEAKGMNPLGKAESWNAYWLNRIQWLQSGHQENPQRYIDYIIEQRRAAGLPELTGYP
jgi:hypothetical protein